MGNGKNREKKLQNGLKFGNDNLDILFPLLNIKRKWIIMWLSEIGQHRWILCGKSQENKQGAWRG